MINWIIMIFFQLYTLGYLDLGQIFTTNLVLLLICRGLYIISYYFNYYKNNNSTKTEERLFTHKEIAVFTTKQISIIVFGIIYFPIAIFIAFYSLLISTTYFKQIVIKHRIKYADLVLKACNVLIPIAGIIGQ